MEEQLNDENNIEKDILMSDSSSKVRVALRIRPMLHKELIEGSLKCIKPIPNTNKILIGKDKNFSFDNVFDELTKQEDIYKLFVKDLVMGCFSGYNATILAYGQTGSGKTFTMGSSISTKPEEEGIIGRVIKELFSEIERKKDKIEFILKISFLEIYNEEIYDLLDTTLSTSNRLKNQYTKNSSINIREEKDGSISLYGMIEEKVSTFEEMISCLERGSLNRTTASTLMNELSSRSHAIFTIFIEQHQIDDLFKNDSELQPSSPNGFMTAKFHFVDLAGSERLKKTGATGTIMREGININRGLLVLGNVIAALTDTTNTITHVPYRESKLTRILQDSLGGNSLTGMIACVSPAESNYEESLNTIKYASRARNIKNTPHINRDPHGAIVSQLKQQLFELQNENNMYRQMLNAYNIKFDDKKRNSYTSNEKNNQTPISPISPIFKQFNENSSDDIRNLKIRLVQLEKFNNQLTSENQTKQKKLNELEIAYYTNKRDRDITKIQNEKFAAVLQANKLLEKAIDTTEMAKIGVIEDYQQQIKKLNNDLMKKEEFIKEMQIEYENLLICSRRDHELLVEKTKTLTMMKKQVLKLESSMNSITKQVQPEQELEPNTNQSNIEKESDNEDEEDEELKKLELELANLSKMTEKELNMVVGALNEKEELLKNITEDHMEMEQNLVETMKHQYHQKISNLEGELGLLISEMKKIETQRDKAISKLNTNGDTQQINNEKNKVILSYKSKISGLEAQLRDFRKKEKEQANLDKMVQVQQSKINELASEIKNIKQQKILLYKKYKEDLEKFEKYKNSRAKEKIDWKKKEMEKEVQISKLKNEKERMFLVIKKKDDEIINNKKSQELFRNLCNKDYKPQNIRRYPTRKKILQKLYDEKGNIIIENELNEELSMQLVDLIVHKINISLEVNLKIQNEEEELRQTENDLEKEQKKHSEIFLKKEQYLLKNKDILNDLEEEETNKEIIKELNVELDEHNGRIERLEDKIEFIRNKINENLKLLKSNSTSEIEINLLRNDKLNNSSSCKLIIKNLILRIKEIIEELIKNKENLKKKNF